jgi:endogenous inhibitor of DNA gyrase (YacG/DUF329 family)
MKCPTCSKETNWKDNPFRPFCSERCKLVDFGRWVNEEYRVPDERPASNEGEDTALPEDSNQIGDFAQ